MQKGALLAEGNTAEIYAWDDRHILKLFRSRYSHDYAVYEARMAGAVNAAGIYSPMVTDVIELEGRTGIIYSRVDGITMSACWRERPVSRLISLARQTAELQTAIHRTPAANQLPRQRERLIQKIHEAAGLRDTTKQKILLRLDTLPDGNAICHGDFHPENILFTAQGPVIIDWIDATVGHPLADVARTYVLMDGGAKASPLSKLVEKLAIRAFLFEYLRHYCRLTGVHPKAIREWLPIVAAARLNETVGSQEAVLVAFVEKAAGRW
jgi:uncharacterized protein (TIGR02172 family)